MSAAVLLAFAFVVIVGGSNFVGVRIVNRELDPFFGAATRFVIADVLLFAIIAARRTPFPRGRGLRGAIAFGLLNFFAGYAFVYWGLQRAPAALAGVVFGAIPLVTLILAVIQRQERFRARALVGAAIAIVGVAVMAGDPGAVDVPLVYAMAIVMSALCAAESAIVIKHFPSIDPFVQNAVAIATGAPLLLALSLATGETWRFPHSASTWFWQIELATLGTAGLFVAYVYVVQRWTASASAYQFVLFPIVTGVTGWLVAGEPLNRSIAIGAAFVIAGTYVGALAPTRSAEAAGR
jgi:drug/metabolite transporter (DMT)-like permease